MAGEFVCVDGEVLCQGLRCVASRSEEPILCLVASDTIKLVAVSGLRLVVSWQTRLPQAPLSSSAFLIPPLIADLLATDTVCAQTSVQLAVRNKKVMATLTDPLGSYELHWASDLSSFPAPEAFGQALKVPDLLMDVPHIRFSDAAHRAVVKLAEIEANGEHSPTDLALLIDLDYGRLLVNGQEIVMTASHRYYFDPRLIIRALEFLKGKILAVGVSPLPGGKRGYLSLVTDEKDWTVHCSLLSIDRDTQKLYPLPPGRNR